MEIHGNSSLARGIHGIHGVLQFFTDLSSCIPHPFAIECHGFLTQRSWMIVHSFSSFPANFMLQQWTWLFHASTRVNFPPFVSSRSNEFARVRLQKKKSTEIFRGIWQGRRSMWVSVKSLRESFDHSWLENLPLTTVAWEGPIVALLTMNDLLRTVFPGRGYSSSDTRKLDAYVFVPHSRCCIGELPLWRLWMIRGLTVKKN